MNYFSRSYRHARERFVASLKKSGFQHESHSIGLEGPAGEDLTIDVGVRRAESAANAIVVSSGLHGVEGFVGSAVQLALLNDETWLNASRDRTVVMIHAMNPYGFAWLRRWNEDNVDLNRSFMPAQSVRPDAPAEYRDLLALLNPPSPPSRSDMFLPLALRSLWQQAWAAHRKGTPVWRMFAAGFAKLKSTLPTGQYEYPSGLFFGGHKESVLQKVLQENLPVWVGNVSQTIHIDIHSGLGKWADYKLLVRPKPTPQALGFLKQHFDVERLDYETKLDDPSISYQANGTFANWAAELFKSNRYQVLTAEFGTYSNLHVLECLRAENRAHHWGQPQSEHAWTKAKLLEAFAPQNDSWRTSCVHQGVQICHQGIAV